MTERQALVSVYSYLKFGPKRTKLLISYFGNAKAVFDAKYNDLIKTGLSAKLAKDFINYRKRFDHKQYFKRLRTYSINFITYKDKDYPRNLKGLDNMPLVIYTKGKLLTKDKKSIAIVGSRNMDVYGKRVTRKITKELIDYKITIISGLARGVDTESHKAALRSGGRTIAVLPCGLNKVYPPENAYLAKQISSNGALVSEYPLDYPVQKFNFINRNRIISGLSKAVVVVQGKRRSGTLLTASHAAEQGRPLFSVPGDMTNPLSEAPHFLIKQGSGIYLSTKEVLEELDIS